MPTTALRSSATFIASVYTDAVDGGSSEAAAGNVGITEALKVKHKE